MSEESKAVRVQAITLVFYGGKRYRPGEVLVVESERFFNPRCMRRLKDKPGQVAIPASYSYAPKAKLAYGSDPERDPAEIPPGEEPADEKEAGKKPPIDTSVASVANLEEESTESKPDEAKPGTQAEERVEDQDIL